MADNALVINTGTALSMASDDISSVHYPRVKISVGADGAAADWQGTINSVAALTSGSVRMTVGTLTTGSVTNLAMQHAGTIDATSQFPPNPWQANVSVGTSVLGTIKPAVSGSAIFVTDLIISAGTATTVVIGMGGTSTPLMGTLSFAQYGGLAMPFKVPGSVTSGSALVYKQSADNTLSIYAAGFVR